MAAANTGVSKAMLGQIERGESSPTVAILWKIASGFSTSLSLFLEPAPAPLEITTVRDAADLRRKPATDDMLVAALFPYEEKTGLEVMELTLAAGYSRISDPHESGVIEHVIVTKGSIELLIAGSWQKLRKGQAAKFAADTEHGYRNLNKTETVFLNIICYQR